jgi:hypothetical protein
MQHGVEKGLTKKLLIYLAQLDEELWRKLTDGEERAHYGAGLQGLQLQ